MSKDVHSVLTEISGVSSTNEKLRILQVSKGVQHLKEVLYLTYSGRVKYYLRIIPEYTPSKRPTLNLGDALETLRAIARGSLEARYAKELLATTLAGLTVADATLVERIIARDLRAGINRTMINKVFPKHIEDTPYMGAIAFSSTAVKNILYTCGYVLSQIKMDGRYANAIVAGGVPFFESRQGEATLLPECVVMQELRKFPDVVLNGELTIPGIPRTESNGIIASIISVQSKLATGTPDADTALKKFETKHGSFEDMCNAIVYTVWDWLPIPLYNQAYADTFYEARLHRLIDLLQEQGCSSVQLIKTRKLRSYEAVMQHFKSALKKGEEGLVVKSPKGYWTDGKPKTQVKVKLEITVDLEIVDFCWGTGKNEGVISSIMCRSSDGLLHATAHGLTEELMEYVTKNRRRLKGTIMEVTCSGISQNENKEYSLFFPRISAKKIAAFRDDKVVADSLEDIRKIAEAFTDEI